MITKFESRLRLFSAEGDIRPGVHAGFGIFFD